MIKSTAEKTIDTIKQFLDACFNQKFDDIFHQFCAPDFKIHVPSSWQVVHSEEFTGIDDVRSMHDAYRAAFKVTQTEIKDIFAACDNPNKITVRWVSQGHHIGDYFGIAKTDNAYSNDGITIFELNSQGQIKEVWQSWDMLGMLHQLNALSIDRTPC